jgi:hypothetical protein
MLMGIQLLGFVSQSIATGSFSISAQARRDDDSDRKRILNLTRHPHSANDRHGKRSLKKIRHLRLIKLSRL